MSPPSPPPFPNPSSFTIPIPNPNPNPNPNFYSPHHHHYHPPSSTATSSVPPPPNPPDLLPIALSTLKNLIHLSEATIRSSSSIFPAVSSAAAAKCPFNPHHRIPLESLFSHSLRCPSSPSPICLSPLNQNQNQNQSIHTISLLSTSDFFYQDCPAVVTIPPKETTSSTTNQFLTLPEILFNSIGEVEKGFTDCQIRFLPSEIWSMKRETEAWNDYPTLYSHTIHRAILCLCSSTCRKELIDVISVWVIVNSPRYGVVIDVSVRDHILLLLRLCLKAITSEATGLVNTDRHEFSLKCPVLGQVLMWFGTQLSILYGEMNGKLFASHIFKLLILNSATNSLMFSEEPIGSSRDEHNDGEIFVSQVAAAVAALHERSLLEEKIKAIRYSRQLNNSQRIAEHEYVSKRANDERQKRADYRPIIEHDVLLWQRARNQETNIMKSREELLAEERDYKRRRMSYRGKKMKRTTTQVMRDIIEDYMEEIKAAGGFGFSLDEAEEAGKVTPEPIPVHGISADNLIEKGFLDNIKTKNIVLIHGEGFGAWCWYKTIALLEESGLLPTALDLTGSGIELTNTNNVTTLLDYSKPLIDYLQNLPENEKVILVGHSTGGACISYALNHFPLKISKAVFVCATMVSDGQRPFDVFAEQLGSAELFMKETKFLIYGNGKDQPPTGFMLEKQQMHGLYFNQSPSKDVALAMVSMRPAPLGPIMEKMSLSPEKYGTGRRFYIQTLDDHALSPDIQEKLVRENPPEGVFKIKGSDHCPFFSKPQSLHKILLEIAQIP